MPAVDSANCAATARRRPLGLVALAVPVRDSDGRAVARLSIRALEARMLIKELLAHHPLLRWTAACLSPVLYNLGGTQKE